MENPILIVILIFFNMVWSYLLHLDLHDIKDLLEAEG